MGQAKDYADRLGVRFTYSTNGQGFYAIDMETGQEGRIAAFPTPDELWQRTFQQPSAWRDRFSLVPFEDRGGYFQSRYYQDVAVERVLEALADGQSRILLTLATGTGKTFIAFQIAWKLFRSRWNLSRQPTRTPRILFLADRNILADQAFNAFSAFPDGALIRIAPDEIKKRGRVPTSGSIFFTIFQTFMSGPGDSPHFGDYPPDFFDLVIIDECHRGGANDESTWRAILEYFAPAVQLGLTATPKRDVNADTYAYFGDPVYTYSLVTGINDGYLTPFKVRQFQSNLDEYTYTGADEVVAGEVAPGQTFSEGEINTKVEIRQREASRVQRFMSEIDQREKTLVFCASQPHALLIRDLINQTKTSRDPNYCHRVTADEGARGEQWLRDFQDNEKSIPTILTTSRKLSTGVDARNIRNIVLLRPIGSMVEFKQIIGRGTRLFDGKDYFTIYDFVGAHHHFQDPAWDGDPLEVIRDQSPATPPAPRPTPLPIDDGPTTAEESAPPRPKIRIALADGTTRNIQYVATTTFWHPDGRPMSAQEFVANLFGQLPALFQDEAQLRTIWSAPHTRTQLLAGLAERGFDKPQLAEIQRLIDADHSDLFDVLAHIAWALPPVSRAARAAHARAQFGTLFTTQQQAFLDFVLAHYVTEGTDELSPEKLAPLLKIRYHDSLPDAVRDLGPPDQINRVFTTFQRYLYQPRLVA